MSKEDKYRGLQGSATVFIERINDCSSVSQLRHCFIKNRLIIHESAILSAFRDRIQWMVDRALVSERKSLFDLRDDIEVEIDNAWIKSLQDIERTWAAKVKSLEIRNRELQILIVSKQIENSGKITDFLGRKLSDIEREAIYATLNLFDGNITRTAKALGISIRTVRNKINKYKEEYAEWALQENK